jgi:glyoxylase-like metal-dependent hydrolase (beta-lactamase superfamily II)
MARIERVVTSGQFTLDGGSWDVDNNVWLVGDDREVLVIDAAHDADAVLAAVGDRRLVGIICTHAHNDHVNAAAEVADRARARVLLHPADEVLWDMVYPDRRPDGPLADGEEIVVADTALHVMHTPGHAPGTRPNCGPSSAATPCFRGDQARRAGPTPTSTPSSNRSAADC